MAGCSKTCTRHRPEADRGRGRAAILRGVDEGAFYVYPNDRLQEQMKAQFARVLANEAPTAPPAIVGAIG